MFLKINITDFNEILNSKFTCKHLNFNSKYFRHAYE